MSSPSLAETKRNRSDLPHTLRDIPDEAAFLDLIQTQGREAGSSGTAGAVSPLEFGMKLAGLDEESRDIGRPNLHWSPGEPHASKILSPAPDKDNSSTRPVPRISGNLEVLRANPRPLLRA